MGVTKSPNLWTFALTNIAFAILNVTADDLSFQKVCGNKNGTFSISKAESLVTKIPEGEITTVFMNYEPEYVFECKSNHGSNPTNTLWPEIKFEQPNLNRQENKYGGKMYIFYYESK